MGVRKTYDEMADRYQYSGDSYHVLNDKYGFGQVWLSIAYVDLKEGGDTFWVRSLRKGDNWHWIEDPSFILLIDGQRFSGVGYVSNSEVTQEAGFFETKVYCNEEIHCGGDLGILQLLANCTSAKFRLRDKDFVLPASIIADAKEIMSDLQHTGGYGDN